MHSLKHRVLATFKRYEKPISLAFEALDQAAEFQKSPSTLTAVRMAFGITKAVVNAIPKTSSYWFSTELWAPAAASSMRYLHDEALLSGRYPVRALEVDPGARKDDDGRATGAQIVTVDGVDIGVDNVHGHPEVFVPRDNMDGAKAALVSAVRAHFSKPVVLTCEWTNIGYVMKAHFDNTSTYPTSRVVSLSKRFKKYRDKGFNRSYLFHGPPGTGKTTIVQSVCEFMSMKSVRFRVTDAIHIPVTEVLEAMRPDAVLIDDIDRLEDAPGFLLSMLEELHRRVPFTFVSVNSRGVLDPAAIRPARIDDMILIEEADQDTVLSVIGRKNKHLAPFVKKWPIAFLAELAIRIEAEPEREDEFVAELAERVRFNDVSRDGAYGSGAADVVKKPAAKAGRARSRPAEDGRPDARHVKG